MEVGDLFTGVNRECYPRTIYKFKGIREVKGETVYVASPVYLNGYHFTKEYEGGFHFKKEMFTELHYINDDGKDPYRYRPLTKHDYPLHVFARAIITRADIPLDTWKKVWTTPLPIQKI